LGITSALQWRPINGLELNLDGLYGQFKSDRDEFHIHARGTVAGESALTDDSDYYTRNGQKVPLGPAVINNIQINDHNEAVYLDVSNTNLGTESRVQKTKNRFDQVAFSTRWDATDRLEVTALAGVEQSNYDIPVGDKFYTEAYGGIITDFTRDKYYATNTYDFDTTDPKNFRADSFEFRQDYQSSRLSTFKLDLKYKLFDADAVKFGAARRTFKNSGYAYELDALDFDEFQSGTLNDDISSLAYVYRNHDRLSWIAVNVPAAERYYGVDRDTVIPKDRLDDWRVEESTSTAYAEYDFDRLAGDRRVRGNFGVRRYKTDQTSIGQINGDPGTAESSYGGWLPSLNLAYDITNSLVARAAYSKNINRVGLDMIRLNASAQVEGGDINVSAGNPDLKPYSAHNFDVALDYYFGKVGAVSLSYFYKIIDGFPQIAVANDVPFAETGLPLNSIPGVTLTPTTVVAAFSRPINLDAFHLSGVEINAQSDLVFLPAPFDQFGVVANLTLVNSEVDYATPDQIAAGEHYRAPLTGLSHTSGNLTLYYETEKWGARISANHRSGWLDRGSPALRDGRIEDDSDGWLPTTYVDLAAHYSLNDHIRFTFDGINITNQREVQWVNSTQRPHNTLISGSTYFVGVNFRR
jgi:iron complex outermembrane recepter protein